MISHFTCSKKEDITLQDIDIQYFSSLKQIKKSVWNQGAAPNDIFLQYDYLSVLENFPPLNMSFAYIVFFSEKNPIGAAYFQITPFDAASSLKNSNPTSLFIAKQLNFNVLVIGNALLTGEHGFYFSRTIEKEIQDRISYLSQKVRELEISEAKISAENSRYVLNWNLPFKN